MAISCGGNFGSSFIFLIMGLLSLNLYNKINQRAKHGNNNNEAIIMFHQSSHSNGALNTVLGPKNGQDLMYLPVPNTL